MCLHWSSDGATCDLCGEKAPKQPIEPSNSQSVNYMDTIIRSVKNLLESNIKTAEIASITKISSQNINKYRRHAVPIEKMSVENLRKLYFFSINHNDEVFKKLKGVRAMKFYEAILDLPIKEDLAGAYIKAIEDSESRYMTENVVTDKEGNVISDKPKIVWRGNYCTAIYDAEGQTIKICLISRTQSNLEQSVNEYLNLGAELLFKNWG